MLDERALAYVHDYDEMIGALRARMAELGVTNETMDYITGLQSGYVGKLLGPSRIKNLGPKSFGAMLQSLGLKIVIVEDAETSEKMKSRWQKREKAKPTRTIVRAPRATWLFSARSGRRVRKRYLKKLSKSERSQIGTRLVQARWQREREKETRLRLARQARPI
jgi:hypothetical protein